jgi:PRC-barrel domain
MQLLKAAIDATEGHIGSVHDLYFDDQTWMVRYLVVDTGTWLPGRKVLRAPEAILTPWHGETVISVKLAKDQVRSSPDIDTPNRSPRQAEQLAKLAARRQKWIEQFDAERITRRSSRSAWTK